MKSKYVIMFFLLLIFSSFAFISCGGDKEPSVEGEGQAENNPVKDAELQRYSIERQKELNQGRTPCDTIAITEFVLNHFPQGTYLLYFDKVLTFNIQKQAVIYTTKDGASYIFGVIARSRPGERLIEPKNVIGYDQGYIDLDSTKLGTAFIYLCLFKCNGDNSFDVIWEAPIPSHGGFNRITYETWNNIPYVRANFHYAQGTGHIDYNYFLVDGLTSFPHLLMTYKGINFQRTFLDFNKDKFPDYYEYLYVDNGDKVYAVDSIPFYWSPKDSVYINSRNKQQTRPY